MGFLKNIFSPWAVECADTEPINREGQALLKISPATMLISFYFFLMMCIPFKKFLKIIDQHTNQTVSRSYYIMIPPLTPKAFIKFQAHSLSSTRTAELGLQFRNWMAFLLLLFYYGRDFFSRVSQCSPGLEFTL